jgi:UDP-N-acetylglucosamine 2-epimerase (non-hydrolysing)
LCGVLGEIAESIPLIFPVHPRTRKNIGENRLLATMANHRKLLLPEPLNYIRFMNLVFHCRFVITDSGGIQEETTHLHIPCLTIRENTERPITLTYGTNQLCDGNDLKEKIDQILRNPIQREGKVIEYWDGKTAERIVSCLKALKRRKNTRKGPSNA